MASHLLTDQDVLKLRRYIEIVDRLQVLVYKRLGGGPLPEDPTSPEVYVVRAPSTGITGLDQNTTGTGTIDLQDDTISSATCTVYQLLDGRLMRTNHSILVYNMLTTDIEGNALILAVKDKWGTWWTPGFGLSFAECH